eukprot:GSMAST32.ASY1.ANO1.2512.1 assembled CDS
MRASLFIVIGIIAFVTPWTEARKKTADPKDCEVCIKVLEGIEETLEKKDRKELTVMENKIEKYCKKKTLDRKQKKVCYYILPIKREVSKPLKMRMTAKEICSRKLKKKSADICSVKYKVKTTADTDYSKMRVKHLKAVLSERGVSCTGCLEKTDYVKKAIETAHMDL